MIKIVSKFNVTGNGLDTSNCAVFSVRDRFANCYSKHGESLYEFCHKDQLVTTEPEVQQIASLAGVVCVFSFDSDNLYDLHVKKGSVFDWAELTPEIERLLTKRGERIQGIRVRKPMVKTVKDFIEVLQALPQELEVISCNDYGLRLAAPDAVIVHAAEDEDGVVRSKTKGYGKDYVVVW